MSKQANPKRRYNDEDESGDVEVIVEPRRKQKSTGTLRVVDSVGDTFEVIDIRWVGGR